MSNIKVATLFDARDSFEPECFSKLKEIITEEEAWNRVFQSEEFESEVETLREDWKNNGISYFHGFHLRDDGNVEVEA